MDLQQEMHLTFLIVTHDQEEAMTMADRISVMRDGKIVQVATPEIIYEAPATRYVADFIGSVNIMEGEVEHSRNGLTRIAAKTGATIEAESSLDVTPGEMVYFAIRPEKLRLSRRAPADEQVNALRGEVWDIAYLGDMTLFNVKLASGDIVRTATLNAARGSDKPIGYDEEVWLTFPADAGIVLGK